VAKPLLETSRNGYMAAMSASSYSMVSCVQRFAPIMNKGGAILSLGFIAAVQVPRTAAAAAHAAAAAAAAATAAAAAAATAAAHAHVVTRMGVPLRWVWE
jgi:enoyl-[acyl-carrier protein] reductase I